MNRNVFYNINTVAGDKYLGDNICNELYDYYVYGGKVFNYDVNINKEDFSEIFSVINNSISTILSVDEVKKAFLQYVQLIMADARDGKYVDACYFISCIDYMGLDLMDNVFLKKVRKVLKTVKKSLNGKFLSSDNVKK